MNIGKIVMTIFGLIALYLILAHGKEFNEAIRTTGNTALKGVAVLQGRDASAAV